ncbi:MAG: ATP-binding cassette domain-containing protein [Desulfovibrionales bacterium]
MPAALFEFNEVTFSYGTGSPVLEKVTLSIPPGGFVQITGPSGSGKSTFLRLLCRLADPTSGTIFFQGIDIRSTDPPLLRRKIAYLQQTPVVVSGTVRENLLLPFSFRANQDRKPPDDRELRSVLDAFQLDTIGLDAGAGNLSVGQKQRLCLIRAMLLSPTAMLLDEPTSALDPENAAKVIAASVRLNTEQDMTVLMVTHGREPVSAKTLQILEIDKGEVRYR